MSKKKKIILISGFIALITAVLVITFVIIKNKTQRYEVPIVIFAGESDKNWADEDYEKYAKHLINSLGSDYCKKAYLEDKNIVIYFTEKQRKKAVKSLVNLFNNYSFLALDGMVGYRIVSLSSDYKTIDVMFNEGYNDNAFGKIIEYPTLLTLQIYNGETADTSSVTVNASFIDSDEVKTKVITVENLYD